MTGMDREFTEPGVWALIEAFNRTVRSLHEHYELSVHYY